MREQILSAGANLLIAKPANGEVRLASCVRARDSASCVRVSACVTCACDIVWLVGKCRKWVKGLVCVTPTHLPADNLKPTVYSACQEIIRSLHEHIWAYWDQLAHDAEARHEGEAGESPGPGPGPGPATDPPTGNADGPGPGPSSGK